MSKETTAKLQQLVEAEIASTKRTILTEMGILDEHGVLRIVADVDHDGNTRALKKLADLTPNPEKTQVMGNVFLVTGLVKQRVAVFYNTKGEVFASANIKSGTNFTHRLPVFINAGYKEAWNEVMKILPKYLAAQGTI